MKWTTRHITVHCTLPATTSEVLTLHTWHQRDLMRAILDGTEPTGDAIVEVLTWVVPYVTRVEYMGERVDEDAHDALDYLLDPIEIILLARSIVDQVSIPPHVIEEIDAYMTAIYAGGCQCRVCTGAREDTPYNRKISGCAYQGVTKYARLLVSQWWPVAEEPVMDRPYHFYQLKQCRITAENRAAAEREAARKRKARTRELLKSRGFM